MNSIPTKIVKVGCDIESMDRFEKLLLDKHFLNRYLTAREQVLLASREQPVKILALIFSIKESLRKALWDVARPEFREMETGTDDVPPTVSLLGRYAIDLDVRIDYEWLDDQVVVWLSVVVRENRRRHEDC